MTEIADRYGRIADGFTERLAGVGPDELAAPTPCTDWTVLDLVCHVIGTNLAVGARVGAPAAEADRDGDLRAQWADASQAIRDALGDGEKAG
ncbi:MAG TPA: maleylpyruvate isomerase N-terminal domain-containing protein, partial [Acidimicrobiales bacterium]|nr:maleylpyruvate isomerase N-terminal domain-containing protein [Acidimicrobiales bacterium]